MKASGNKKGSVVEVGGAVVLITELKIQITSSRIDNTLYKVRGRNVLGGQQLQEGFQGERSDPGDRAGAPPGAVPRLCLGWLHLEGLGDPRLERPAGEVGVADAPWKLGLTRPTLYFIARPLPTPE